MTLFSFILERYFLHDEKTLIFYFVNIEDIIPVPSGISYWLSKIICQRVASVKVTFNFLFVFGFLKLHRAIGVEFNFICAAFGHP